MPPVEAGEGARSAVTPGIEVSQYKAARQFEILTPQVCAVKQMFGSLLLDCELEESATKVATAQ
jgi:hypothetical protein